MSAVARNGRLLEGRTTLVTEIRSCRGNRSSISNAFLICMSVGGLSLRDKANYRASFTLPNRLPLKPTVVQFTVGKPSQIGRCARFIPSNLVRCEQFDNDIPVAFRIHL